MTKTYTQRPEEKRIRSVKLRYADKVASKYRRYHDDAEEEEDFDIIEVDVEVE
jgi:hypothetical protein